MENKRIQERIQLFLYLKVLDRESGNPVGYVMDITSTGFMMIAEAPVVEGSNLSLKMILPSDFVTKQLDFDAECRWCRRDPEEDFYSVGCQLLGISDRDRESIRALIDRLS